VLTPEPRHNAPTQRVLPYPRGVMRWIFRSPLLAYRLGLGELLARARIVVLTTVGHKSGQARHTVVEYRRHGSKIYVIAAWGEQTHWVQNLATNPIATIQSGVRTYTVRAQRVENPSEVLRALFLFRKPAPAVYDALLARITDADTVNTRLLPQLASQLTVVRFDLDEAQDAPTGVRVDLLWVWVGLLAGIFLSWQLRKRK
jgi:deazaflavin-dependent oxidoreductase (nitroreductase family)